MTASPYAAGPRLPQCGDFTRSRSLRGAQTAVFARLRAGTSNAPPRCMLARGSTVATACSYALVLPVLALLACTEPSDVTGVRLTMHYGASTPSRLRVVGTTLEGRAFGPSLMPDPMRALAPSRESLLVRLPDSMDGVVLAISVAGLDQGLEPRVRGTVQTEVVRDQIQNLFVVLTGDPDCPAGTHLSLDGDCIRSRTEAPAPGDADNVQTGTSVGGRDGAAASGPDASAPDAPDAEAASCESMTCSDAAVVQEPPPDAGPAEPPPPPPACPDPPCRTTLICSELMTTCDVKCAAGARCDIACGGAEKCKPTCAPGADCEIACGSSSACEDIHCDGDARCLLRCSGDKCDLHCAKDSVKTRCSSGVVVCNRECPDEPGGEERD